MSFCKHRLALNLIGNQHNIFELLWYKKENRREGKIRWQIGVVAHNFYRFPISITRKISRVKFYYLQRSSDGKFSTSTYIVTKFKFIEW